MGSDDLVPMLQKEIDSVNTFIEKQKESKGISFGTNPYSLISYTAHMCKDRSIDQLLLEQFIPHVINVINSKLPAMVKDDCFACTCDILVKLNSDGIMIPNELINAAG